MVWGFVAAALAGAVLGSVSQPKAPKIPDAPKPEDAMDVIDEINGVQTVIVKGPNGKYRKVTSRLPQTEEEKKVTEWASKLIGETMNNLHELYKTDPNSVPRYTKLLETFTALDEERSKDLANTLGGDIPKQQKFLDEIKSFKDMQKNVLEDAFKKEQNRLQEELIQNGHMDSSAAHEMKAHLAKDKAMAAAQVEVNAEQYGRELADNTLARDMTLYETDRVQRQQDFNAKEQARFQKLNAAASEFDLKNQEEAHAIENERNILGLANAVISKDLQKAQSSNASSDHANGYSQQLAGHQAQVNVAQQRFQNRLQTPNLGQSLGQLGVGIGSMGMGSYASNYYKNQGNQSQQPISPSSFSFKQNFQAPLGKFKF